ncbi:gliding motility-associated C-terminal domain-containing protein [Mucilaginibacter ginkgonis]|uniref:Gliding motility-associated C-terminal domain-containing protein n=1 Tax=Mucilaginibacter ginkgonis TaxID=2682091 RepID=A0A7T7JFV9_9SPHI|nr:gliding motility-associated C-terminal domain-containing protein [Mucilaginibacter ginkgonis]QQL48551.1 gliding motility-associated C-terminal domain-containing protein [Mucilaginibacter ginkgonis]
MSLSKLLICMLMLLGFSVDVNAQCSGTLGDPVINITFGAGAGRGPALPAGTTNLTYVTGCPEDGQYTITSRMNTCFTDNWHLVYYDHTGDTDGRFMVANASIAPSDFYTQTVNGLCSGTTYQFGAWIMNMVGRYGIPPRITFRIEKTDGTLLKSLDTQDIPMSSTPTWLPFSFYFTMPAGVSSVVLRMRNNAPGGVGNDLALDDITFRPSGPAISVGIQNVTGNTATVCESASSGLKLVATADACYLKTAYQWQQSTDNGTTWTDIATATTATYTTSALIAGTYLYRVLVADDGNTGFASCRVVSDALTVKVNAPAASAVNITASANNTCPGVPVTFTATTVNGGTSPAYQWQVNGVNAGANNSTFTTAALKDNDVITCVLITNLPCSVPVTSNALVVNLLNPLTATVSASSTTICAGGTITFTAAAGGTATGLSYEWFINGKTTGETGTTFIAAGLADKDAVTCAITSTTNICNVPVTVVANAVSVTVESPPIVRFPNTLYTVIAGDGVTISPVNVIRGATYQWSPAAGLSRTDIANPVAAPGTTTEYTLTVISALGCYTTSGPVTVKVISAFVPPPNTFTPNGDGYNDLWNIPILVGFNKCTVDVYSRNGRQVFHSIGYSKPWDGTYEGQKLPAGTYYYVIDLKNGSKPYSGYVSLL